MPDKGSFEHADEGVFDPLECFLVMLLHSTGGRKLLVVIEPYNRIWRQELCEKKMEEYCERARKSLLAVKVAKMKRRKSELKNRMH